ncbi:MAG: hypothetical protein JXP34_05865 [Planctomycetes bacterium]|nr:hypothetical protein [Planctomycetota bacterium]
MRTARRSACVIAASFAASLALAPAAGAAEGAVVRIGEAEGAPREIVRLPVRITHQEALLLIVISWAFDPAILVPLPPSIEDTASGDLPVQLFSHEVEADGWARPSRACRATGPNGPMSRRRDRRALRGRRRPGRRGIPAGAVRGAFVVDRAGGAMSGRRPESEGCASPSS